MSIRHLALAFSLALCGPALADAPRVVADIAPVHSLVARVMEGAGSPGLIVQPGASPHEYALRPSEAAAVQDADLVFWIGPELTPWLSGALDTLAPGADVTALLEAEGTTQLPLREAALFDAHDPHHDHDEAHDHDDSHGDHAHGDTDPHAWLAPANAAHWLDVIAARLSEADPENADLYRANAATARDDLDTLTAEVTATLAPHRGARFVVFHDAYRHFEHAFDLPASGAITLGDATAPSPARLAEIRERIAGEGITCVLAEPQFNPGLVATVVDGTEARMGVIDPLGADLEPGPALYPQLIRNMASTLADCL
ncbi:zinc ABC transporter substrate-binding protein [Roseovarius sp. SCSIO 43702]|uniref:zinc ABC transporter substrate-binding protein n=1 Tax=Roseovarius sp. SCSIO 43702 TaxID=2823043 RepID=UPI002175A973|nr:zinc ABC transporter substrate-binding protein [Roseovarius sp. SCSIO 43702]